MKKGTFGLSSLRETERGDGLKALGRVSGSGRCRDSEGREGSVAGGIFCLRQHGGNDRREGSVAGGVFRLRLRGGTDEGEGSAAVFVFRLRPCFTSVRYDSLRLFSRTFPSEKI